MSNRIEILQEINNTVYEYLENNPPHSMEYVSVPLSKFRVLKDFFHGVSPTSCNSSSYIMYCGVPLLPSIRDKIIVNGLHV